MSIASQLPSQRHFHCESHEQESQVVCSSENDSESHFISEKTFSVSEMPPKQSRLFLDTSAYQTYAPNRFGGAAYTKKHNATNAPKNRANVFRQMARVDTAFGSPALQNFEDCIDRLRTTPSTAYTSLAASNSGNTVESNTKNQSHSVIPAAHVVCSVFVHWLSLVYEQEFPTNRELQETCCDAYFESTFVPPHLRSAEFLRSKLNDMCWQSGSTAENYIGALAVLEEMSAIVHPAAPEVLQESLSAFFDALGKESVYIYLEKRGIWHLLARRHSLTMNTNSAASVPILCRLAAMSRKLESL